MPVDKHSPARTHRASALKSAALLWQPLSAPSCCIKHIDCGVPPIDLAPIFPCSFTHGLAKLETLRTLRQVDIKRFEQFGPEETELLLKVRVSSFPLGKRSFLGLQCFHQDGDVHLAC